MDIKFDSGLFMVIMINTQRCKYEAKETKMENFINDELKSSSSDDECDNETESDNESDNE